MLDRSIITEVIRFCNRDIVPNSSYNNEEFPSTWFENYFDFIGDKTLEHQLGDAFYQARFLYKLMCALKLPLAKQKGIVKFQIVQYASICEAVLDYSINKFFKDDSEEFLSVVEFQKEITAFASDVKMTRGGQPLFICKEKKRKGVLKLTRIDKKTSFAVNKGLLSDSLKTKLDALYNLRNNVHIIKAAESGYNPKLHEAKDAFITMEEIISHIKSFYSSHSVMSEIHNGE